MRILGVAKAVLAMALLTGCETTYTPAAQQFDVNRCRSFGYAIGSSAYNDCMAQLYAARQQQSRQQNQVLAAVIIGAAAVGTAAVIANNQPQPRYWCSRYRCYWY